MPLEVVSIIQSDKYIDINKKASIIGEFPSIFSDTNVKKLFEGHFTKNLSKLGLN